MINLHNAKFFRSAASPSDFPNNQIPHITFAGRSNVGKSSIINCILNRKDIARVSGTPGKTAHVNLFDIDGKMYLADLPGYGFAKVSDAEKKRWGTLIETYFDVCGVKQDLIKLGVSIVDIRHTPTEDDIGMVNYFKHYAIPFVVVANKSDKLSNSKIEPAVEHICDTLNIEREDLVVFSAEKRVGKDELLKRIFESL